MGFFIKNLTCFAIRLYKTLFDDMYPFFYSFLITWNSSSNQLECVSSKNSRYSKKSHLSIIRDKVRKLFIWWLIISSLLLYLMALIIPPYDQSDLSEVHRVLNVSGRLRVAPSSHKIHKVGVSLGGFMLSLGALITLFVAYHKYLSDIIFGFNSMLRLTKTFISKNGKSK